MPHIGHGDCFLDVALAMEGERHTGSSMTRQGSKRKRAARKGRCLYTIGYEGKDLQAVLTSLLTHGVEQLVDVRENPMSRKPGFSKSTLRESLIAKGIGYLHLRELGTPQAVRDAYRSDGDLDVFRRRYESHLSGQEEALMMLSALAKTKVSALLCFEADWRACHRSILCDTLEREGLTPIHL